MAQVVGQGVKVVEFAAAVALGIKTGVEEYVVETMSSCDAFDGACVACVGGVAEAPWIYNVQVAEPVKTGSACGVLIGAGLERVECGV